MNSKPVRIYKKKLFTVMDIHQPCPTCGYLQISNEYKFCPMCGVIFDWRINHDEDE